MRTINGPVPVTSGTANAGGHEVTGLRGREPRKLRGHIEMIFQGFRLADRISVFNDVLGGRFAHAPSYRTLLGLVAATDRQLSLRALGSVGVLEKVWTRVAALSGGQTQRVAIARALAQEPSVMLPDDPAAGTANTDFEELYGPRSHGHDRLGN